MQKIEIVDISTCKKQINIEVPAEKVSEQFQRVSKMVAQNASVPGFRPGRAPVSVVKMRFRKEIREQVMREMLPDALQNAILDNKLAVIGEPDIDEFTLNEGQAFVFKAKVEVIPEFEIKDFRGMKITKKIRIVTDEMVDKQMENLRQKQANLVPVEDRESQDNDFVNVDIKRKNLDTNEEDSKEGLQLEINGANVEIELSNNLRGMKLGEERTFQINKPKDPDKEDSKEINLEFTVKLNSIKIKEVPALDDDFAQGLGEYENLEDLKKKTKEQFENSAKEEAEERLKETMLEQLLKEHTFDAPETLVTGQIKERVNAFIESLARQGLDPRNTPIDWRRIAETQRELATKDVKCALILEKIAEKEQVELSDEDLNKEIESMSKSVGVSFEATKSFLTKEGAIDSIKTKLRNNKVLDLIIKSSEITESLVPSEELDKEEHHHEHGEHCDHDHEHSHEEIKE